MKTHGPQRISFLYILREISLVLLLCTALFLSACDNDVPTAAQSLTNLQNALNEESFLFLEYADTRCNVSYQDLIVVLRLDAWSPIEQSTDFDGHIRINLGDSYDLYIDGNEACIFDGYADYQGYYAYYSIPEGVEEDLIALHQELSQQASTTPQP